MAVIFIIIKTAPRLKGGWFYLFFLEDFFEAFFAFFFAAIFLYFF
jgi:hypothetical protein